MFSYFLFFFFQAEDGIRDVAVTGVQTCALPISAPPAHPPLADILRLDDPVGIKRGRAGGAARRPVGEPPRVPAVPRAPRSEERRVGKECRSRGARYY